MDSGIDQNSISRRVVDFFVTNQGEESSQSVSMELLECFFLIKFHNN